MKSSLALPGALPHCPKQDTYSNAANVKNLNGRHGAQQLLTRSGKGYKHLLQISPLI